MRSAYVDVPWWLGLLIGGVIVAGSLFGILVERRMDGGFRRSRVVWGSVGLLVGGLLILDAVL